MSYCRNCGAELGENANYCLNCGTERGSGTGYCPNCGEKVNPEQAVCLKCGVALSYARPIFNSNSGTKFVRVNEGKILGGVFTGAEKCYGINRWLGRLVSLLIPLWPAWIILYIIICTQTEMVEN